MNTGDPNTPHLLWNRTRHTAESRKAVGSYLEDSDDGPQQGVKVLPVRDGVARLCLQTELTAEDVHPQDTTTQHKKRLQTEQRLVLSRREQTVCMTSPNKATLVTRGDIQANQLFKLTALSKLP